MITIYDQPLQFMINSYNFEIYGCKIQNCFTILCNCNCKDKLRTSGIYTSDQCLFRVYW